jgi:galactokinase
VDSSLQPGNPPVMLLAAFNESFPDQNIQWLTRAPGREMWAAASYSSNEEFTVVAPELEGKATFSLQSAKSKLTVTRRPLPRWARYPAGVTLLLAQNGLDVSGLNMVVMGNEPSGPRFDYGLGIAFAALWHDLYRLPYTVDTLIEVVERVRREYVEDG